MSDVMPTFGPARRAAAVLVCVALLANVAAIPAGADPTGNPVSADSSPPDDGNVPSPPPATVTTPDGWNLILGAKDETQVPVRPLTTAVSSREYVAGGMFAARLIGPEDPRGILEVGYEIGCGIDMSTSNGVTMAGSAGAAPSLGTTLPIGGLPTNVLPVLSTPFNGVVTVGLKPGLVIVVPVNRKQFKGPNPWVMISNFHVKIDGCVGESFIRSYATLTRQTDESDVVLSYVGSTKAV